jgi:hypothetical protein
MELVTNLSANMLYMDIVSVPPPLASDPHGLTPTYYHKRR